VAGIALRRSYGLPVAKEMAFVALYGRHGRLEKPRIAKIRNQTNNRIFNGP